MGILEFFNYLLTFQDRRKNILVLLFHHSHQNLLIFPRRPNSQQGLPTSRHSFLKEIMDYLVQTISINLWRERFCFLIMLPYGVLLSSVDTHILCLMEHISCTVNHPDI